ncbi:MAG: polyprenyl diphosphate synthase [Pseudomonadota bacterium]|nr:polyprenyl diphosphate synthase [Pseudomonadota bacterium]
MNSKSPKPKHIIIIMDGNGRWAEQNGLLRSAGHKVGVKVLRNLIEHAVKLELTTITVYAFSRENWQRPKKEIELLLDLFISSLESEVKDLHENNIKLNFIGETDKFSEKLKKSMSESESLTSNNSKLTLNVALNYSGRWDIYNALLSIIDDMASKKITKNEINEELINKKLSLADYDEPDLLIRTGGERRLSNYFLWQIAYTEMYFTDILWPDFNADQFDLALDWYAKRQRRFGRTSEQIGENKNA